MSGENERRRPRGAVRAARWLCLAGLTVCLACEDDDVTRGDAGAPRLDGGLRGLTCPQADYEFGRLLGADPLLQQLRSCARDEDCALWQPSLECANVTIRNCSQATRAVDVDATYTRRDELAAMVCPRVLEPCGVGVLCPSGAVPRCVQGSCLAVHDSGTTDGGGI